MNNEFRLLLLVLLFCGSCQEEINFEELPAVAEGDFIKDINSNCTPSITSGIYMAGNQAGAANHLTVRLNFTRAGTFLITTDTVQGLYFRAEGVITITGEQSIDLKAFGTPALPGGNHFNIRFRSSTCKAVVMIDSSVPGGATIELVGSGSPLTCGTPTLNGTYTKGVLLTSANTVRLNVNVLVSGSYTITTSSVNGIVFTGNGSLSLGPQSIILSASGTPLNAGPTVVKVVAGASECSFTVLVSDPAASHDWEFTASAPDRFFQGTTENAILQPSGATLTFTYAGFSTSDDLRFTLRDIAGGIVPGETYTSGAADANSATFVYLLNAGIDQLTTDDSRIMKFNITSHLASSKTITGTFTGTVKNNAGITRTITAGNFTVKYD